MQTVMQQRYRRPTRHQRMPKTLDTIAPSRYSVLFTGEGRVSEYFDILILLAALQPKQKQQ